MHYRRDRFTHRRFSFFYERKMAKYRRHFFRFWMWKKSIASSSHNGTPFGVPSVLCRWIAARRIIYQETDSSRGSFQGQAPVEYTHTQKSQRRPRRRHFGGEIRVRTGSWIAAAPGDQEGCRDRGTRIRLIGRDALAANRRRGGNQPRRWGRAWGVRGCESRKVARGLYKRAADGSSSQSRINRRWTTHHHPRRYSSAGPFFVSSSAYIYIEVRVHFQIHFPFTRAIIFLAF